ncbi:MAG: flavodoxin, partial [Coriobacteriia bacterium]|nr:flavodoxin [Coriobacteriia bacterium]
MSRDYISRRSFISMAGVAAVGAAFALVGCGGSDAPSSTGSSATAPSASESASSTVASSSSSAEPVATSPAGTSLIVLWSWSGNTLQMAERVRALSGAEIYRIEAAEPYPEDYEETADRAKQEQDDGVYPEIANPVANWDSYDTIYLGYPIWWYELPMIVQGFVNDHDWSGKTIVPFNSHLGSGDGGTYDDLRDMTGATVLEGIAIRGDKVADSLEEI